MNKFTISLITLVMFSALACFTFSLAGTWNLPFFWAVLISQAFIGIIAICLLDKDLLAERFRPGGKDKDPFTQIILSILCLAMLAVAALDVGQWHLSDKVPSSIQIAAIILQSMGWIGLFWSMKVNAFFSSAIRLQPDRKQHVITGGPYHFIRHPGYAFASLAFLAESIALGSWLSVIPAFLIVADLLYRTNLEENMLQQGLPGYAEYSSKVRYRWLPGLW